VEVQEEVVMKDSKAYFRGCLLGGAIGDALGYPVEFMDLQEIMGTYGNEGIRDLQINEASGNALISDDTQMTVFTVDGLVWADKKAKTKGIYAYVPCVFYAYQKWYYTQTGHFADNKYEFLSDGEVFHWEELFARRTPGETILEALAGSIRGKFGSIKNRINNSKGYGAVVRSAPIGLYFFREPEKAFRIGCEVAALTHGHSDAFLSAGYLSCLMAFVIQGLSLEDAVQRALSLLKEEKNSETVQGALEKALGLATEKEDPKKALPRLGEGWVAEEALAMAVFCALRYPENYGDAVVAAANQDGNSNGAAAICGSILGAYLGSLEIPYEWIRQVELSDLMVHGADKLLEAVK